METILLILVICVINAYCFVIGAKVGQKVVRQEPIETNPIKALNKAVEEHKEAQIKEAEDDYYKALMHNIDNYNGDSIGQVEIPRRK